MTDAYGRNIPGDDESPDLPKAFEDFSLSMPPGPLTVASRAEANAIRTAAGNPVGLHVWRTDTNQEERWNGSGWEYVAGRQHGATVSYARTIVQGTVGRLHATAFVRNSVGWTMNGEGYLVIPQTGMYLMTVDLNIAGSAGTLGKQFVQFGLRDGGAAGTPFGFRTHAQNENNYGATVVWPLSAGNQVQIQAYHEGGGDRAYTATLQIAMINAPNW